MEASVFDFLYILVKVQHIRLYYIVHYGDSQTTFFESNIPEGPSFILIPLLNITVKCEALCTCGTLYIFIM